MDTFNKLFHHHMFYLDKCNQVLIYCFYKKLQFNKLLFILSVLQTVHSDEDFAHSLHFASHFKQSPVSLVKNPDGQTHSSLNSTFFFVKH